MTGWKREAIPCHDASPAMRLDIARTHTSDGVFDPVKYQNSCACSQAPGFHGVEPLRITRKQQRNTDCTPQPAIAGACGEQHPHANPARRTPPVETAHQAVIRRAECFLCACECHNAAASNESNFLSGSSLRLFQPQYQAKDCSRRNSLPQTAARKRRAGSTPRFFGSRAPWTIQCRKSFASSASSSFLIRHRAHRGRAVAPLHSHTHCARPGLLQMCV